MGFIGGLFNSHTSPNVQSPGLQNSDFGNQFWDQGNNNVSTGNGYINQGNSFYNQAGNDYNNQQQLVQALQAQASGQGPSVANAQYQQSIQDNANQANALAAGQRGVSSGLAMKQALAAQGQANAQSAAQANVGRQQEQLNAQNSLGGVLQGMRNENLSALNNSNQTGLGFYKNANENYGQSLGAAQSNLGGAMQANSINAGIAQNNANNDNATGGAIINGIGGGLAMLAKGGQVPGKAPVPGNSPSNDTVPAMLSPGEIVIPRTSANDPEKAKEFVDHIMKGKGKSDGPSGYAAILALKNRISELENRVGKKGGAK